MKSEKSQLRRLLRRGYVDQGGYVDQVGFVEQGKAGALFFYPTKQSGVIATVTTPRGEK